MNKYVTQARGIELSEIALTTFDKTELMLTMSISIGVKNAELKTPYKHREHNSNEFRKNGFETIPSYVMANSLRYGLSGTTT